MIKKRLKHILNVLGVALLFSGIAIAQPAGYQYYKQITLNSSQISGTHSNFPILISITDSDLIGKVQPDGDDIIFASDANGTVIYDHQIESYNSTNGTYRAWVRIPSISSANNTLVMFYGNSAATNTSTTDTWNTNYQLVMHMDDVNDQSGKGNNGTNTGTTSTTGKIGNARSFTTSGGNDYISIADDATLDITGNITISAWINVTNFGDTPDLITKGDYSDSYSTWIRNGGTLRFATNNASLTSTGSISSGTTAYVTFTKTNSGRTIYINGSASGNDNSTTAFATNNDPLFISSSDYGLNGFVDEVRISNVARSANWISTEYNNQNNPATFHSFGAEQSTDVTAPTAPQNVAATAVTGGDIQITFDDVDETGSGVSSYSIKRSTTQGGSYSQVGTISDNESASYTYTDNSTTNGITYYYVISAIDGASNQSVNSAEVSATADATSPQVNSREVTNSSLVVQYDETLDITSIPALSDYSVTVNGNSRTITNLLVGTNSVTLTLSPAVENGDVVVVSYTSGTNKIKDTAGNTASSFTNATVINNTQGFTATPPQSVNATAIINGDIEIDFLDVAAGSEIASYSVKRSTSQGGPYSQIGTVTDNNSSSYSFIDTTPINGTKYYYVVTSIDQNSNESTSSPETSAVADSDAPTVESILAGGTTLLLDYDELLDTATVPSATDFTVKINGSTISVASVSILNVRVTLELSTAVQSGDNVTLSYVSGVNKIRDIATNNASNFSDQNVGNYAKIITPFGPDPCPITNGSDVSWACFDGANGGTSMTAKVGDLEIATVTAASGSQTTFAPNALQEWSSGEFSGDEYNGPQINPIGNGGYATNFDINIPSSVSSDAIILSLNKLRPYAGNTSYTLEAFNSSNVKVPINGWLTGQGGDGGVCTNSINLNYTNGNTTLEFQPVVSGNQACNSSSNPIWFKITDNGISRIEIRKTVNEGDNIHIGLALVADFGDAPNTYRTAYNSRGNEPAFHILSNTGSPTVYFGAGVDADGNGVSNVNANSDTDDGISSIPVLRTNDTNYSIELSCTTGGKVGGWIDVNQNGFFDSNEYAYAECASGSATLNWGGLSGLVVGQTYARFRIASTASEIANPFGVAWDGEVEDYTITIEEASTPDLEIEKIVNNSTPIVGEVVTFTVSVTNPGEFIASGIQVTDQLPAGLTYNSHSVSQGTYNVGTGIWNIGTLSDGDTTTVTLTILLQVNSGTLGSTINNSASITSLIENDPNLSNNSATVGITVVPEAADIAITKTVNNSSPIVGEFIQYTVEVTNNGPKTATNLKVIDQIPSGITYMDSVVTVGAYNPVSGIWTIGTLANQATATLTINGRIQEDTEAQTIVNSADLNSLDQNDTNTANNTASASLTVSIPSLNLSCGQSFPNFTNPTLLSGTGGQVGALYKFNNVLTDVYATVKIISVNNATLLNIDDDNNPGVANAHEFSPYIENPSGGGDAFMDFEISFFDANTDLTKYLSFSATTSDVDGTGDLRDFVGYQNLNSYVVENSTELIPGSEGIYSTFISNNFVNTAPGQPNFTDYKVYATYTNEKKFKIRAGIKAGTTNGGRAISLNFNPCEYGTFSNPVSQVINDVAVIKTVDDNTVTVGQQVTYTIQATNKRSSAVTNAEITDVIPSGMSFVSATASQGSYNSTNGKWTLGSLSGLQVETLELVLSVNSGTIGDLITNTATLTNIDGTDGISTNNTSSVDVQVYDSGAPSSCVEPPLFSFNNPILEEGSPLQLNAVYRFPNIGAGTDALVKVKSINNATLDNIDANNLANSNANFSPLFTPTQSGGHVDFEIKFVQSGTIIPIKKNFALTGLDIDGSSPGGGQYIRDFLGFSQNQASIFQNGNKLDESFSGPFRTFISNTSDDGVGSFDINHMAYIVYRYTSVFEIRTGSNTLGGYSDDRLVDIDFTQCRNNDFTDPVTTTRDADIAITKTVDEANPLENGTVNYLITVTNNGGENATEIDVNEKIPAGLTLVQATASQGIFNSLTNIWAVGSLNNGVSATLAIEATVNSGVTAPSIENKAYVVGLNQSDPTAANDTAKVSIFISNQVDGIIFKDKTGNGITDGDTNFDDAAGDQQALSDVIVHLFKDGGDGIANGNDDTYLRADTTNISGFYSFQIGEDADYWIVVNSKTGSLSDGSTWGEQVYAPKGGLCTDGSGNETSKVSAGNCFGGRRGSQSDNVPAIPTASDLANAEHVAKFTLNSTSITDLDFGFSFNVVTNTRDGDDDLSANRSIQGSLRQFITNANSISGANTMRFVPTVATNASGSSGNWWNILLNSALPVITDPLTTIDGKSYSLTAPTSVLNPNSGTVGIGGQVGTEQQSLSTFERKELELNLNDVGTNGFRINSSGAVNVLNLAVYNNAEALKLDGTSNGTISNNFFGARADGTDPAGSNRAELGVSISGSSFVSVLIQSNYFAFTTNSGIKSTNSNSSLQFTKNEVYKTAQTENNADGIEGIGTWTITRNLIHENGKSNGSDVYGGAGLELGINSSASSSGHLIRNNSFLNNVTSGINVLNAVSSTLIEKNIIKGNGTDYSSSPFKGAGIRLSFPDAQPQQGILMTKNSFANNKGLAIDIVTGGSGAADGVTPNDGIIKSATVEPNRGLDYPVFTLATIDGNQLTVEGYMGKSTNKLNGLFTIEIYKAANDGNQEGLTETGGTLVRPHGEGETLVGTITTNSNGTFSETFTVSGTTLVLNDRISAIAFDQSNNTSEFSTNQRIVATGVTVNGFVYVDENHNTLREGNESGIQNVTIVLFNKQLNNCKSVLTDVNGRYEFTNVLNGEYDLIESYGQSVPTPDICTPAEVDPLNHVSTTPNLRTITINNLPAQQNFGDFHGSKITGKVIKDNGIGGGTANDAIQNGAETGLENTIVKALTGSNTFIKQTNTNGNGEFTLYVPSTAVGTGSTIKIKETNITSYISTGGNAGTTSGSYSIATDEISFTNTVGTEYKNLIFSDVATSILLTDGTQNVLPGAIALFQHTFEAKTAGDVTFTVSSINNPNNPSWPIILYRDLNCNGNVDSGEPILDASNPQSVTATQTICLVLKVSVPQGLNNGSTSTTTINANFQFANTSPAIQQNLTRTDQVTVNDTEAGLILIKTVDQNQALPGATLTYSVSYQNNGDTPISALEIIDNTPTYTTFNTATCGTLPNNLTGCTITAPNVGNAGGIKWTFAGTLEPGSTGIVSFTVIIDN